LLTKGSTRGRMGKDKEWGELLVIYYPKGGGNKELTAKNWAERQLCNKRLGPEVNQEERGYKKRGWIKEGKKGFKRGVKVSPTRAGNRVGGENEGREWVKIHLFACQTVREKGDEREETWNTTNEGGVGRNAKNGCGKKTVVGNDVHPE